MYRGKNIVYIGFGTIRGFRHQLGVLESIPANKGGFTVLMYRISIKLCFQPHMSCPSSAVPGVLYLSIVLLVKWPLLICILCTRPKFLPSSYFSYHFSCIQKTPRTFCPFGFVHTLYIILVHFQWCLRRDLKCYICYILNSHT